MKPQALIALSLALLLTSPVLAQQARLDNAALEKTAKTTGASIQRKFEAGLRDPKQFVADIAALDDAIARAADPRCDGATLCRVVKAEYLLELNQPDPAFTIIDEVLRLHPFTQKSSPESTRWNHIAWGLKGSYYLKTERRAALVDLVKAAREARVHPQTLQQLQALDIYGRCKDHAEKGEKGAIEKLIAEAKSLKLNDDVIDALRGELKKSAYGLGRVFPEFKIRGVAVKDSEGKALSLASYRGKVVLIDFWATWCGPCVAEMPKVIAAYKKYQDKGFAIVGVSLDNDKKAMEKFTADKGMTWRQYFDGRVWNNYLVEQYGIDSIPATFLLDREGKIIGRDLRGDALEAAIKKALGE